MCPETVAVCLFVLAVAMYVPYRIWTRRKKSVATNQETRSLQEFIVTETLSSTWHYHLSDGTNPFVSLCGKRVFPTRIPLGYFRSIVGRRPERLEDGHACPECSKFLD